MNLYFRLIWVLLRAMFRPRLPPDAESVTTWRVLPTDVDAFGHMNNARYLAVMDLARMDFVVRLGLLRVMLTRRWVAPVVSLKVDFRGGLAPLQRYTVHTRAVSVSDRSFLLEQVFRAHDGRRVGGAEVEVVFRGPGGVVTPAELLRATGQDPELLPRRAEPAGASSVPVAPVPAAPVSTASAEPLAVVGIGCRLPGGVTDAESLFQMLLDGTDCIVDIPSSRWAPQTHHDPTGRSPGRSYVQRAGLLKDDPRLFDAAFFGISPREAETLDPQQRMLLEVSHEALEDAGIPTDSLAGSRTGVFSGGFMMDNLLIHAHPDSRDRIGPHAATASTLTMLSNRLSYVYDLWGPSVSVDTACSSSLVATHLAASSLWSGESELALVCGVNAILVPETQITMSKGRFLSPSGRCQAFAEGADGYVRAEGAVVLVLKPLSAARRDGNPVHAVILGTAVNQDGRTPGITVPNGRAQVEVMREAYARAGVDPVSVGYVEAHGTGTPLGDPIEASAIGEVLGAGRPEGEPCLLGSLKTNVGHLEAAAGLAGVAKAALAVSRGLVPPNLHRGGVNPAIDLGALGLAIPTEPTPLPRSAGRRIAGVNAFGYGGTNAHVVLAEAPPLPPASWPQRSAPFVLPVSAKTPEALAELSRAYADQIEAAPDRLGAICRAAGVHRSHHRHRAAFMGNDPSEIVAELRALEQNRPGERPLDPAPALVFVYTGMGPQRPGMGRELLSSQPAFREAIEEADATFSALAGWSIVRALAEDADRFRMERTEVAQPANAALQIGLTALWASWGVRPDVVIGHSVGEVGSAYAASVLDAGAAMAVAFHRSRLQQQLAGRGGMLAAEVDASEAAALSAASGGTLAIAAINAPRSVTFAGPPAALSEAARWLAERGRFHRSLEVEIPYHSALMDEISDELRQALDDLAPCAPRLPLYSTVTGGRLPDGQRMDGDYFVRNVRDPVRFASAIGEICEQGPAVFVEIGPHPVLARAIAEVARERAATAALVPSLVRGMPEIEAMTRGWAKLYTSGLSLDHAAFFGPGEHVPLPRYPWQRSLWWSEGPATQKRTESYDHPLITSASSHPIGSWTAEINLGRTRWLEDHVVAGAALFPAAGFVEMAIEARRSSSGDPQVSIEDLELRSAVPLRAEEKTRLRLVAQPSLPDFRIELLAGERDPVCVAAGKRFSAGAVPPPLPLAQLRQRATGRCGAEEVYALLQRWGLAYGPAFRAITEIHRAGDTFLAEIELPEDLDDPGYHLHPVLLDAALHALVSLAPSGDASGETGELVPVRIGRVQYFESPRGRRIVAVGRQTRRGAELFEGEVTLARPDGAVFATVTGLSARILRETSSARPGRLAGLTYERAWRALSAHEPPPSLHWLVLGPCPAPHPSHAGALLAPRPDEVRQAVEALKNGKPIGILDARFMRSSRDDDPVSAGAEAAAELLETVAALPAGSVGRYVLAVVGAEAAVEGDAPNLAVAPLVGLARTVMTERPDLGLVSVDLDRVLPAAEVIARIAGAGDEQELAVRGERTLAARIARSALAPAEPPQVRPEGAYRLALGAPGRLDEIAFAATDRPPPGPGEVEIEVEIASLGFKDVMKALGLLSARVLDGTYFGDAVGMEGSGRIVRLGEGVTDRAVGDRVYALAPGFLRSHVVVASQQTVPLPDTLSDEDGSNLIVFMTVYHALVDVARLEAGETVLIHGASGGIGLAAIEVARWRGARIIATAGTEDKRAWLRSRGIEHVSASRDVSFADDVARWTEGRGVDVVLNFTPGEIVAKGIACLAPFGRFLEIGKMSFDQDEALQLRPFNENLLYAAIDLDRILARKPHEILRIARHVTALLAEGQLAPLPSRRFGASEVGEAFRTFARGQHRGKICVALRDEALTVRPAPRPRLDPGATWLVTGGLDGFGARVARWLAAEGVRHLALASRRGEAAAGAASLVAELQHLGANARIFAADIGDREACRDLLDQIRATMPPLQGVMHAAAVLDDRALAQLDRASLRRVLHPKARGAWNLHLETARDRLEHFVLFSSVSSWIGNGGQGNYVAANAFLDQLALHRRSRGLPATAIAWGALADAGMVARDARLARHLSRLGIEGLPEDEALHALGAVLDAAPPQTAVMDVAWSKLSQSALLPGAGGARLLELVGDETSGPSAEGGEAAALVRVGRSDPAQMAQRLRDLVVRSVCRVTKAAPEAIDPAQPLRETGMDSLIALEIAADLEGVLGAKVPAMILAGGGSPESIAKALAAHLLPEPPRRGAPLEAPGAVVSP